jgi:hypothetical protein
MLDSAPRLLLSVDHPTSQDGARSIAAMLGAAVVEVGDRGSMTSVWVAVVSSKNAIVSSKNAIVSSFRMHLARRPAERSSEDDHAPLDRADASGGCPISRHRHRAEVGNLPIRAGADLWRVDGRAAGGSGRASVCGWCRVVAAQQPNA